MNRTPGGTPIAGFLVVRKPDRMAEEMPAPDPTTPIYHGLDRMPWWDLSGRFYAGDLPEPLRTRWRQLEGANQDRTGVLVCPDPAVAGELLAASNADDLHNELIAIDSGLFRRVKGATALPSGAAFLGFDVFVPGYWSLLKDGVHKVPALFPSWGEALNEYGLLPTPERAAEYNDAYQRATAAGAVEDIPAAGYQIDIVAVWRFSST